MVGLLLDHPGDPVSLVPGVGLSINFFSLILTSKAIESQTLSSILSLELSRLFFDLLLKLVAEAIECLTLLLVLELLDPLSFDPSS